MPVIRSALRESPTRSPDQGRFCRDVEVFGGEGPSRENDARGSQFDLNSPRPTRLWMSENTSPSRDASEEVAHSTDVSRRRLLKWIVGGVGTVSSSARRDLSWSITASFR